MGNKGSTEGRKRGNRPEKNIIGILAFEVASAMSKCMQLWQSLNDEVVGRLRSEVMKGEGVLKLVSDSEEVLLGLACTEKLKELSSLAALVGRLGQRCEDAALQGFTGDIWNQIDAYAPSEMEAKMKEMGRYVDATANLYNVLQLENAREASEGKIARQREHWRRISLWNRSYGQVVELLARTVCTIHGRIVCVFGPQMVHSGGLYLSASTLGGAALALHYSKAIVVIENLARFPSFLDSDSRHSLYNMLPHNLRSVLRARLKALPFDDSSLDLAQCRAASNQILGWLAPLAHNTIQWHSQHVQWHSQHVFDLQVACHSNILLLQTLYFADQLKAEAAIVDLLVSLTCVFLHEDDSEVNVSLKYDIKDLEGISRKLVHEYSFRGEYVIPSL